MKIHYQPEGHAFGDCMPFYSNGVYYLFHQRDTRNPGPFGEPFGWCLATSTDFVKYEDKGEPIPGGGDDSVDQFIFAGSIYEGIDGDYRAIYTGYNRDRVGTGIPSQVLLEAKSPDLIHWEKDGRFELPPPEGYDPENWRDPFVLWDDNAQQWMMILGARLDGPPTKDTGRTVWFSSADQTNWKFEGDLWAPDLYTMHEMPDLFQIDGKWYLLTTEYSEKSKTIYCVSDNPTGPWSRPSDDAFDGRSYYAARSVSDGDRRFLVGWVATKTDDVEAADFEWGGTLVILEVVQREDSTLGVKFPDEVWAHATEVRETLDSMSLEATSGGKTSVLGNIDDSSYGLAARLRAAPGTRSVSVLFGGDVDNEDWYSFKIDFNDNQLDFDRVPNWPWNRYNNKGLHRPLPANLSDDEIVVRLLVDDSVATILVNDIALTARVAAPSGTALGLSVADGSVAVTDAFVGRFKS